VITDVFEKLISILERYFPELISNIGNDIVLNDGVLVGRLAPAMDGTMQKAKRREGLSV
jgi:hypothetical protein